MFEGNPSRLPKILHVAESVRGGIATYFNELHPLQLATLGGANLHYVVPSDHIPDLHAVDRDFITGYRRTGRNLASIVRFILATFAVIKQQRPDIVHLHSTFAGLALRPLIFFLFRNVSIIYCPHGWAFSRKTSALSNAVSGLVERLLSPLTHRIICISRSEYDLARSVGIDESRLLIVRNGIKPQRQIRRHWSPPRLSSNALRVLFIGRLDRQKGYDLLLEAARELGQTFEFRLIGASVVERSASLETPPNVTMLGWLSHERIEMELDEADIVVVPSRWEPFGLVTLEAMRACKPIVAFRVGALPEIVQDGVTGILCEPVTVKALVSGMRRAARLDLPSAGQAGYARFLSYFVVNNTHVALMAIYRKVLADRSASQTPQQGRLADAA